MEDRKITIMQPYFLPYIGYFQLLNAVDLFVVYDNIQYTKKSWINKNRIIENKKDTLFTLPLKKDSDYLDIRERFLNENEKNKNHAKILNKIKNNYGKAPFYDESINTICKIFNHDEINLFDFVFNSIETIKAYLDITTELVISSKIEDGALKHKYRVWDICKKLNSQNYINPIGGLNLYNKEEFKKNGINLSFLKTDNIVYNQFNNEEFITNLSIIDMLMFNGKEKTKKFLNNYTLI